MRLPGLKGEWAKPDKTEVNAAGVPTYTWNFGAPVLSGLTPASEATQAKFWNAMRRAERLVKRQMAALDKKQRRRK